MCKKIIGIVICMLLISSSTTLALTPFNRDGQQTKNQIVETTLVPLLNSGGWMKTFGGIFDDYCFSVQQTNDGGYIMTGATSSFGFGNYDVWLIKTDSNGDLIWNVTFGGVASDVGSFVQQTTDGGYIILGYTESFGAGDGDLWLIKIDNIGNKVWDNCFGGTENENVGSVQQTTDGGYIMTGRTYSFGAGGCDVWLIKTDNSGNEEWNRTFGATNYESGTFVQQTNDGGYIITGMNNSLDNIDVLLIKTDGNGNKLWEKTFVGKWYDTSDSVQKTIDGGYIIIGYTVPIGASGDVWLIKTDGYGNEEWNRTFGGTEDDGGKCVQQTTDGGYIITGYTESFGAGKLDVWLIKTDDNGDMVWDRTFGGPNSEMGLSVQQTIDDGYIITGYKIKKSLIIEYNYDAWLIKTDSQGKSKTTSSDNLWFEWLFQRFPNAFPLLRHMMGY